MKKIISNVEKKEGIAKKLADFAHLFSYVGANAACFGFYHEAPKPDLKKLRKF